MGEHQDERHCINCDGWYPIQEPVMAQGKWISYLRASTGRQGRSGLGLEAQHKAVEDFLNGGRWQLVKEFVEVESGKKRISTGRFLAKPSKPAGCMARSWSSLSWID